MCRVSLFVFLLFIYDVDSLGRKRCKDSSECNQPLDEEFCDVNYLACMPCAPYCTGSPEKERSCADHCPKRYAAVYGSHKQLSVPEPKVLPLKENPAPAENNDRDDDPKVSAMKEDTAEEPKENTDSHHDDNGSGNVVAVVVVIAVVVIMIAVVAIRRYQRPERGYQQGRLDAEDPRARLDVNSNEDTERINEDTAEPDGRTPDQADPERYERSQCVTSVSGLPSQTLTDISEIKERIN